MLSAFVALLGGLILLVLASNWLVDGAVGIARRFGVSTLVIGMTIVAYGTSAPELVVSLLAATRGVADFAIGNIVGSNVANIGLVLGAVALVAPFSVSSRLLFSRDLPLLGVATALAIFFFSDRAVQPWEGGVLLALAAAFTLLSLKMPAEDDDEPLEPADDSQPRWRAGAMVALGLAGLMGGAHFMVEGGSAIATHFGISERVIGLTVVAVGTSLPELAASLAGALKGHPGLAVGNVVGSCLFNLAFVLGATGAIGTIPVSLDAMVWDLVVMCGLTLLMWLMLRTGRRLTRSEGATLMLIYVGFLGYLVVSTAQALASPA